jgi:hypothetical protein
MLQAGKSQVQVPMSSLNFVFNLLNHSNLTMALGLTRSLTEKSTRKCFWEVESGGCVRLMSPPSVSQLSSQCGVLSISQPSWPSRPVTGIALLFTNCRLSQITNCILH